MGLPHGDGIDLLEVGHVESGFEVTRAWLAMISILSQIVPSIAKLHFRLPHGDGVDLCEVGDVDMLSPVLRSLVHGLPGYRF